MAAGRRHLTRATVVLVAGLVGLPLLDGPARATPADRATAAARATGPAGPAHPARQGGRLTGFDVRTDLTPARRAALAAKDRSAPLVAFRRGLGAQGVLDLDPVTMTPRQVTKLNGFLTGPSRRPAAEIALGYVRSHPGVFGLSPADLRALKLRKDYVDIVGTHHLSWVQTVGPTKVLGNGLRAHVTRDGRLVAVQGSPIAGAAAGAALLGSGTRTASVSSSAALAVARRDATFAGGPSTAQGTPERVAFATADGVRPAWRTTVRAADGTLVATVVDANTSAVLQRRILTLNFAAAGTTTTTTGTAGPGSTGLVVQTSPGAAIGGRRVPVDFVAKGWLPRTATMLKGPYVHAFNDLSGDGVVQPGEEIRRNANGFRAPLRTLPGLAPGCRAPLLCTWDPRKPLSWKANLRADAVQAFALTNQFHDHLLAAPIGFTRAAGNYDARDGDAVRVTAAYGVDNRTGKVTDSNAVSFETAPDGQKVTLNLGFSQAVPGLTINPASFAQVAEVIYHEYTHGLSTRLVVTADGEDALRTSQSEALGEGWSDFYAMDYLAGRGLRPDTKTPGELHLVAAIDPTRNSRTQAIDCPVAAPARFCPGSAGLHPGGYTFGDLRTTMSEVHWAGELLSQTLWDLRTALGTRLTRSLVTRAMEISPDGTGFLDVRNAILSADMIVDRGRSQAAIWKVFARRGMGFYAASLNGDDTSPAADDSLPPAPGTRPATLTGRVSDPDTGLPLAGALIEFSGQASAFGTGLNTRTGADGRYRIPGVLPGTYPKFTVTLPGHTRVMRTITVSGDRPVLDLTLARNWAATDGGAKLGTTNDPIGNANGSPGCGVAALIDGRQDSGWISLRYDPASGRQAARFVTVRLPRPVTVSAVGVDTAVTGCLAGDASAPASARKVRVQISTDGNRFTVAAEPTFTKADRGRLVRVPLRTGAGTRVVAVRYTILSVLGDTTPCPATSPPGSNTPVRCLYMGSAELQVYGRPA